VIDRVGVSYSTIWRMYRAGQFPAPIRVSARIVGWRERDVDAWIAAREERRRIG
jgi:prophage regulatory protein